MNQSGAMLAWKFFFPEQAVPDLIRFVQDRDLWNWAFPESAAFLSALDLEPNEFPRWAEVALIWYVGRLVDAGVPVLSQSVLLRGVNDRLEVLETLYERLICPHCGHPLTVCRSDDVEFEAVEDTCHAKAAVDQWHRDQRGEPTPGVVVDGKVVHAGGVPSRDKIRSWLI